MSKTVPADLDQRHRLLAVAEAMDRLDVAIECLTSAYRSLNYALPVNHDATLSVESANERARVARAKVELALRRIR